MKKIVVRSTIDVVEHLVNVPGILEGIGLDLYTQYSMRVWQSSRSRNFYNYEAWSICMFFLPCPG